MKEDKDKPYNIFDETDQDLLEQLMKDDSDFDSTMLFDEEITEEDFSSDWLQEMEKLDNTAVEDIELKRQEKSDDDILENLLNQSNDTEVKEADISKQNNPLKEKQDLKEEAFPEENTDMGLDDMEALFDSISDTIAITEESDSDYKEPAFSKEEESAEDVFSIDEFLNELNSDDSSNETNMKTADDVGGIFSEALSAVSNLDDMEVVPDFTEPDENTLDVEEKKRKQKKPKKDKGGQAGFFSRIFGNIKKERTDEEVERLKQKLVSEAEEKEQLEEAKRQKAIQDAEAKKAKKIQDAADQKAAKMAAAKAKEEKAAAKKDEKIRKAQELQALIDEIQEDEGKINPIGACVIFVLFALIGVFTVIGTNTYSYSINIAEAEENFERQLYNNAYQNVYGMSIKETDIELYDKIMTVMFVNKQLNSYNNYYAIGMYEDALDALLKGLERYDKYITLASMLGIESDLNYVHTQILAELASIFHLTKEEASYIINNSEDRIKYSNQVYNVVSERMQLPNIKK